MLKQRYDLRDGIMGGGWRGTLLASVALMVPVCGFAQQAENSDSIQTISVSGSRVGPISQKRDAAGVVDTINAEQIQELPDSTIAETLVHLPGVSVTANSDNERGRNAAQHPAIRGLDAKYNNVSIDGLPLAATDFVNGGVSSRATPLDVLPSSLVQSIAVYKTYSPDRDPQAIGGAIELTTRSAYDNGGAPFFQGTSTGGFNSLNSKPARQTPVNGGADLIASDTFGRDREFGAVLSASFLRTVDYTYTNATTDTVFYNFYNAAGQQVATPTQSNGLAVPQQSKSWISEEETKTADLTTKFEYRPNDRISAFASLGYYSTVDDWTRNEMILTAAGPVSNQTATTGAFSRGDVEVGGQYSPFSRTTKNFQGGATYRLTDSDVLDIRAGDSTATWRQPQQMVKFINQTTNSPTTGSAVATSPANGFNYSLTDNYSNFNMNPSAFSNSANYGGFYWRYRDREIDTAVNSAKFDYGHNVEAGATGFGFKIGADVRQTRNSLLFKTTEYDPNTTGQVNLSVAQLPSNMTIPNYSTLPFLFINVPAAFQYLNSHPELFHSTNQNANNNASNFALRETVIDGYGMAVWNAEAWHAMAGVRRDGASVDVSGNQQLPNPSGVTVSALGNSLLPAFQPIRTQSNYANYLPAASISYTPVTSLQLRSAVSQTIGRPDYSDYAPNSAITQDATTGTVTITQGNPSLKPRLATNYDVAVEWYPNSRSMLSIAPFYKNIADEIFSITTNGTILFNGATVPSVLTEPVNASNSTLKGIEFELLRNNFGDRVPWLEGFGADLNFTLLRGSATVPAPTGGSRNIEHLINQPDYIGNMVLTYQRGDFDAAVAFNYTGTSLRLLNASAPWQDVYWAPHEQLDLKVGYRLRDDLQLTAAIKNLTDEPVKSVTGPGRNLLKDISYVGQTFMFNLVYRPSL